MAEKGLFSPDRTNAVVGKVFSPVTVPESPVSKTAQHGNLTGNARKVRDSAADIYNFIQEWNTYHLSGHEILLKINLLKSYSFRQENVADRNKEYPDGLLELCSEMDKIYSSLSDVLKRMTTVGSEIEGVIKLEKMRNTNTTALFLTWTAEHFGETLNCITECYRKELSLKCYVKENIAHVTDEANMMFLTASWVHQPYLSVDLDIRLEALLKETGHR